MKPIPDDVLRIAQTDAAHVLSGLPQPFAVLFQRADVSVELFAPRKIDTQSPHTRDELYIVASGSGVFVRAGQRTEFQSGDLLFVPAHVEHRFEQFTGDFRTWVIFFGPEQPAATA
ncbi:MAG: cupin domain-containing protein [Paraburkholderia sp.]|nr:MAG: cupin domain-containing protein [Paraburkholderia sp.]